MTVFRAVENRRSLVRAANTGISGCVDPSGRISARTDLFEDAALICDVPVLEGESLYARTGDLFPVVCIAVGAIAVFRSRKRNGT